MKILILYWDNFTRTIASGTMKEERHIKAAIMPIIRQSETSFWVGLLIAWYETLKKGRKEISNKMEDKRLRER